LLDNLLYCMRMDVDPRGFGPEIMIDTRHTIFKVNTYRCSKQQLVTATCDDQVD
jgi:hypothetical protein